MSKATSSRVARWDLDFTTDLYAAVVDMVNSTPTLHGERLRPLLVVHLGCYDWGVTPRRACSRLYSGSLHILSRAHPRIEQSNTLALMWQDASWTDVKNSFKTAAMSATLRHFAQPNLTVKADEFSSSMKDELFRTLNRVAKLDLMPSVEVVK